MSYFRKKIRFKIHLRALNPCKELRVAKIGIEAIATKKLSSFKNHLGVVYFGVYSVLSWTTTFLGALFSKRLLYSLKQLPNANAIIQKTER
jgi:hypothetical protein